MKRIEIDDKYKWKLEHIYATNEDWEAEFEREKASYKKIEEYRGKLKEKDMLLECLRLYDKTYQNLIKLFVYSRMRRDEDSRVDLYVGMSERIESLINDFASSASYITSEISRLKDSYLSEVIADPDFSDFDFMLKEIKRTKKHILSEKEEKLLSMASGALGGYQDAFTMLNNLDLPMPTLKIEGEKVKLTHGKYSYFLTSDNPRTRKAAFMGMYDAIKQVINTIAVLYASNVKKDNFYSKARGTKSALEGALYNKNIPMQVYKNLIKSVRKNQKIMHRYVALRKKALGLRTMHMYDMYIPIVKDINMSMDYEDAYNLVIEGLKPMGKEYKDLLIQARDNGWVDVMENEGKRSGAYSWGCYDTHPYVLLNYSRTTHDIFTIAHELGHAMHSYYSNQTQAHAKARYQIFVAEVASTVNEVLLIKHLLNTAKDKQARMFVLNYYLDMFRTTLFRQTMFAEFEMIAHDMESSGQPLTVNSLSEVYYDLNKKYYGRSVRHDDDIRYEWARIPHFYTAFYVYQYATGLTSAINIVKNILEDSSFSEVYKNKFLCAGGSDSPYEILKQTGVDLATSAPFEVAMKEFNDALQELKKELE